MPITIESLGSTRVPTRATDGSVGYDVHAYLRPGRRIRIFNPSVPDGWDTNDHYRDVVDVVPRFPLEDAVTYVNGEPEAPVFAIDLFPLERAVIPLGFKAQMPFGMEAQVRPRSGRALKEGLIVVNSPGTIDPDYGEEWGVLVGNIGSQPIRIAHDDRIAQLVFQMVSLPTFREGVVTNERSGFGSTGQ